MTATDERANDLRLALIAIADHRDRYGYPPTRRELASRLGRSSPSTGHDLMRDLMAQGLIEVRPNTPRGVTITGAGMKALTATI